MTPCACVSHDARRCVAIRYNRPDNLDNADDDGDDGRCDCDCHHDDDAEDWEEYGC